MSGVCVLSQEDTGRLEHYGIWPACASHPHISKTRALEGVAAETHRFVGGPDTAVGFVSAVVETNTTRIWSPVQCHHESGKAIRGMRTWGFKPLK